MEKILFQSNGSSKKNGNTRMVACFLLIIIGIFFCALSQIKVSSTGNATVQNYGNVSVYSLGKAYFFDDNIRLVFIIVGVLLCIYALFMLIIIKKSKNKTKTYFRIYENHIEGSSYDGMVQREFNLEYRQITDVQLARTMGVNAILINSSGSKYTVLLDDDANIAYRLINERIRNN